MTTQHIQPDENETAIRAALLKLGARPAGHAPSDEPEQPTPPAPVAVVPPMPEHPPTIPAQEPRRAGQSRLPDWWREDKPALTTDTDDGQDDERDGEVVNPDDGQDDDHAENADDGQDDEASERHDRPRWPRRRRVSKEPSADQGEQPEEDDEEDDDEVRRVGEGRGRWLRLPVGRSQRPRFSTPVFPRQERERKSLAQAWREIPPEAKFAAYHLTGLATGTLFGVVGYATEVTRSIADSPLPLRDNPDAYFWGAGAFLVLAVDRVTRKWAWLVGWCTRGITVSLIVGAVLHGNTVGEAIADLPTLLDRLSDQP